MTIDPVAQRLVNPCLPATTAGPEMVDHILRQPNSSRHLGIFAQRTPSADSRLGNFSGQPSLDRSGAAVSRSKSCAIELSFPFIGFPQCNVQQTTFHFINDIATLHQLKIRHDHHNFRTPLAILLASILYSPCDGILCHYQQENKPRKLYCTKFHDRPYLDVSSRTLPV